MIMEHNSSVGRIVIFVPDDNVWPKDLRNFAEELPAIVTRVWPNNGVNLKVINDGVQEVWYTSVPYSEEVKQGTWHWPVIEKESNV